MSASLSDRLTQRFYAWERRGRGWDAFEVPVDPEPLFHPFFGHVMRQEKNGDDSRRPTLLSSFVGLFKGEAPAVQNTGPDPYEIPPVQAQYFESADTMSVLRAVLPKGEQLRMDDMEHVLVMLSYTEYPVSFEIQATGERIHIQFTVRGPDARHLYGQVKAYFPAVLLHDCPAGLDLLADGLETCAVEFGLTNEFMLPLRTLSGRDKDPFIGLFGVLEDICTDEQGTLQILFHGAVNPWAQSVMAAVTDNSGGSFFENSPDMVKRAREKIASPLYGVCVRVAGQAREPYRAMEIAQGMTNAIVRMSASGDNILQMLPQDMYPVDDLIDDMFLRRTHRIGMLLNSTELCTFVHFPTDEIVSAKIDRDARKTKAAPESAQGHNFVLGINIHQGRQMEVSVPASLRLRHTHVIGATGTGKSSLLVSMIAQDMRLGNGVAVIDPHGDLIEAVLGRVPEHRMHDVIVIDPADSEYPVGFNILSAHSEIEKDILSSDLVAAFRRLSTSWGDQMNSVFANAILAFLENPDGGTLADLRRFLIEKPFRDKYLKNVQDPHIVYYWQHEYPLLKSSSIGSILTRLDTFLRPKIIRNMVVQKKGLDFENILDTQKIVLVKLSQGLMGEENSYLLGTFFVSKMYQAAMARQAKAERKDFFLYIDEFHHYATPSMSHLLSGARKYHLGLILAHQDMQQLQKQDGELASSVVVNAGTRICFRLGDTDAKRFAGGFAHFDAEDLENLRTGEAIARIEQPNLDFNLATMPLPQQEAGHTKAMARAVIELSRRAYGTPRMEIEAGCQHARPAEAPEVVVSVPAPSKPPEPPTAANVEALKPKPETEHRYLQMLIKRMAESRGYKATIEEMTPDGKGRVDVSLEREGKRIACEVSVTTDAAWEVHNIQKCLTAGYDEVIVCSDDLRMVQKLRTLIAKELTEVEQKKVLIVLPNELAKHFDTQIVKDSNADVIMKGYRVNVEYTPLIEEEMRVRKESIIRTISRAKRADDH